MSGLLRNSFLLFLLIVLWASPLFGREEETLLVLAEESPEVQMIPKSVDPGRFNKWFQSHEVPRSSFTEPETGVKRDRTTLNELKKFRFFLKELKFYGYSIFKEQFFKRMEEYFKKRIINLFTLYKVADLPGVKVKTVITPYPNKPGASQLENFLNQKYWQASLGTDNRGKQFNGPLQVSLRGNTNSNLKLTSN